MKKDGFKYFTAIIAMNIRWEGGGLNISQTKYL